MKPKELREVIVDTVASFCKTNNIDYKVAWRLIYAEYEEIYKIPVTTWYKMGHRNKLDFLADYEDLYSTLTKMYNLVKELKC